MERPGESTMTPMYGRREKRMSEFSPETRRRAAGDRKIAGQYRGETYYGQPVIKASHYSWPIVGYLFIGGLASAAQFVATVADLIDRPQDRPIVRAGRYLALGGALASPVLLIADLHTPQRWYNMLRIFRGTSPMSIGSWALAIFGTLTGLTAVAQALEDLGHVATGRWMARLFGLPAALAAGIVYLYTGTLLAATSVPLWAAAFPFMSSLFATAAGSTAGAALTLSAEALKAPEGTHRRLERFALIAGAAELTFASLIHRQWRRRGVADPVQQQPMATAWRVGAFGLGMILPLLIHAAHVFTGRRSRRASLLAAVSTLIGGFTLRAVLVFAGNQSARRPEDYFQMTQSGLGK